MAALIITEILPHLHEDAKALVMHHICGPTVNRLPPATHSALTLLYEYLSIVRLDLRLYDWIHGLDAIRMRC